MSEYRIIFLKTVDDCPAPITQARDDMLKGMEGVYDVRQEIPERRSALELWASFLVECERLGMPPGRSNVIPLRGKAA